MITEFSRIKARNELDVKIQPRAKQDQRKGRVSPAERRDKEKGKGRLQGGHGLVTEPRSGPRGASARLGGGARERRATTPGEQARLLNSVFTSPFKTEVRRGDFQTEEESESQMPVERSLELH